MEKISVKVELPVQSWNLVLSALGQQPFKDVADVIGSIKMQAEAQLSMKAAEATSEAAPAPEASAQ